MAWKDLEGVTVAERYELRRHLATGGMAAVFGGWDRQLERPVAVKMLRTLEDADDTERRRFCREARAIAALRSPHIVDLYDFLEDGGCYYLVMELVGGMTLKQLLIERAPLPVESALSITVQVCRALATAHARGFVHRDIKPQNVLIDASGRAKLADFGIVQIAAAPSLTTSGLVLGTADYISPEQARGLPLGPASDLYSLGIVLFEMLTGCLPFTGKTATAVALRHTTDPLPPLRLRNAQVPPEVERVVRRATAKDPARRFRSAQQMEAVLTLTLDAVRTGAIPADTPSAADASPNQPWLAAENLPTRPYAAAAGSARALTLDEAWPPPVSMRFGTQVAHDALARVEASVASMLSKHSVRLALTSAVAVLLAVALLVVGMVR